jgi:hypothetical protein
MLQVASKQRNAMEAPLCFEEGNFHWGSSSHPQSPQVGDTRASCSWAIVVMSGKHGNGNRKYKKGPGDYPGKLPYDHVTVILTALFSH